ncbi:MAG: LPS export ABC transporter periplasmic protein LptC [Phycisphaerae bacterium]|nr:LPS export ABC transporter periplasmic protein LptC [Phycisphaerae bacterium]
MNLESRKLRVWLISAGAVLAIYLFYNLLNRTPPIEFDTGAKFTDAVGDSNIAEFDDKIGMVGDVGVGTVRKAKYTHLDAEKQIDREFGFEKLLHAEGDEWEIEKPYMNIYRHNLKCYMTADKGRVRVVEAVGRATPTDATLTGNVVIHILPENNDNISEGFIYLDDVIFINERSEFSTAGPVKFTSQNAQMLGKGMELVYNDELDRLEFLKIIELEALRIRQSSLASESSGTKRSGSKASLFSSQAATTSPASPQAEQPRTDRPETRKGEHYKCVFRKNVVIDSPEQIILADEISISDILWARASDKKSETKDTGGTDKTKESAKVTEESVTSQQIGLAESPEQFVDIVVTCDGGIAVVPMDSNVVPAQYSKLKSFTDDKGRPAFIASTIDYSMITEDIVAAGPSELTFNINDITSAEVKPAAPVPVKITAQEKTKFSPSSNQVVFQGDVLCTMLRDDIGFQQKYTLSAPKLTVDLSKDKQSRADIKHLTAGGEVVQLDTSKWAGEELLGFTKLKCLQFDYDAAEQMFLAAGSGIIAVDNSKITEPGKKTGKFSLQRPCYVVVRNFDTLKYLAEADVIIADAANEQIIIDYFPVIKGKQQQTTATSNHVEAVLYETSTGQNELSTLSASGGITYEEQKPQKGRTVQFVGSGMFYDGGESMITAWGDESQPCFLNGALAPGIEYNLKSGRIKTKITGPGMLQMER